MFKSFYQWINQIVCFCILTSAVLHVLPDKHYMKYVQLFTGLLLILIILSPFTSIQENGQIFFDENQDLGLKKYQESVVKKQQEFQEILEGILSEDGGNEHE